MSTATFAPTVGAADSLSAAQTIRDKAVAAAAWPISLAKRILNALRGGWTEAFKGIKGAKTFLADAVSAIPTSVKGFLISAPFSTEGGYERVRSSFYWVARKALNLVSAGSIVAMAAIQSAGALVVGAVGVVNKTAALRLAGAVNSGFDLADKTIVSVITKAASVVDYVFVTLGHRVAVRTVTTGATGISALVAAEALSILGVSMGLITTTLSGFVAGTPLLAGLPLVPAMFTSAGVVAVAVASLVAIGGIAAWLFKRSEINDMMLADKVFAKLNADAKASTPASTAKAEDVVVDSTVVRAEVDQLIAEATDAKVQADIAREVINQSRQGGGKRRNK